MISLGDGNSLSYGKKRRLSRGQLLDQPSYDYGQELNKNLNIELHHQLGFVLFHAVIQHTDFVLFVKAELDL